MPSSPDGRELTVRWRVEDEQSGEVESERSGLTVPREEQRPHGVRVGGALALLTRTSLAGLAAVFFLSTALSSRSSSHGKAPPHPLEAKRHSEIVTEQEIAANTDPNIFMVLPKAVTETSVTTTSHTTSVTSTTQTTKTTSQTTATTSTTYTMTYENTVTTTETVFWDHPPASDFPEIMYLTVPESKEDKKRLARMKQEVVKYLPRWHWGIRVIPGVVPELWPMGRYDRVEKYAKMLPEKEKKAEAAPPRRQQAQCSWTFKDDGGLYNHFIEAVPLANSLDACKEACCKDERCNAIRFSPGAEDGPDLQCLLYPRGEEAWSLERPLYKDYRVHLLERHCGDGGCEEEGDDAPAVQDEDEPWWDRHNIDMARVTPAGEHPKDPEAWPSHHAGCSLSHLSMWMEALHRGVQNLIVFESDGFPSCIESYHIGGNASDFADLAAALPSKAPADWDLIALDKGDFGAQPDPIPIAVLKPASAGGERSYTLIPWKGRGVAGAAAYMVSRRFLEWFPEDIKEHGFGMVDAWIGCRCSDKSVANPSPINCFSLVRDGHKLLKDR